MSERPLDGRVAVITGAASGFGRAIAERFAADGARLVLVDIAPIADDELGALAAASGVEPVAVQADVADEDQVAAAVAAAVAAFDGIDVMVNNAGVLGGGWIHDDGATEHLDRNLRINVGGVWNGCRQAILAMTPRSGGVILNTASTAAINPTPGAPAYGLAKAAVVHLTRSLAAGHGRDGIRVNTVLPGPTATNIFAAADMAIDDFDAVYLDNIPLGRMGEPVDVAQAMAFLASDEASFITGAVLTVDGGFQPRHVT